MSIPHFTVKVQETPNGLTLVPPDTWPSAYLEIEGTTYSVSPCDLDGDLRIAPAPVPEPSTMLLLGSGLIGLAGYRRKRFFKK